VHRRGRIKTGRWKSRGKAKKKAKKNRSQHIQTYEEHRITFRNTHFKNI
jgi:hypothetical protein